MQSAGRAAGGCVQTAQKPPEIGDVSPWTRSLSSHASASATMLSKALAAKSVRTFNAVDVMLARRARMDCASKAPT